MSAHFAIPATTFVLKSIIEARLKIAYGAFTPPKVSIEPPPRPPQPPMQGAPQPEPTSLILFLHHAGPNPAWRNMYDPHVDPSGARVSKSPLVLDLYYMLAATGADLERETLLGVGMSALHRDAIVPRPMIQALLSAVAPPAHPTHLMDTLTTEPLADPDNQPESITISQQPIDFTMSTNMWSAFHSPLRPCAYYIATTIFLDTGETYPEPLQVEKVVIAERPVADPAADPSGDQIIVQTEPV
jgi:hypothetical protein